MKVESSLIPSVPLTAAHEARAAAVPAVNTPTAATVEANAGAAEVARQQANRALLEKGSELAFEFDDSVNRVIVRLIDKRTGDVIRQFPSKEMLAIAAALEQGPARGSLVRADV